MVKDFSDTSEGWYNTKGIDIDLKVIVSVYSSFWVRNMGSYKAYASTLRGISL